MQKTADKLAPLVKAIESLVAKLQVAARRANRVLLISLVFALVLSGPALLYLWSQGWEWTAYLIGGLVGVLGIAVVVFWYLLSTIVDLPDGFADLKQFVKEVVTKYSKEEREKLKEVMESKVGLLKIGRHLVLALRAVKDLLWFSINHLGTVQDAMGIMWVANPVFWTAVLVTKVALYVVSGIAVILAGLVYVF